MKEYSKKILAWETVLVYLTTITVLAYIGLAIIRNYLGSLPYLVTLISAVYAAYGTSVAFYYNKAKAENKIKISKSADCEG